MSIKLRKNKLNYYVRPAVLTLLVWFIWYGFDLYGTIIFGWIMVGSFYPIWEAFTFLSIPIFLFSMFSSLFEKLLLKYLQIAFYIFFVDMVFILFLIFIDLFKNFIDHSNLQYKLTWQLLVSFLASMVVLGLIYLFSKNMKEEIKNIIKLMPIILVTVLQMLSYYLITIGVVLIF